MSQAQSITTPTNKSSAIALLPLLLFLATFVGAGVYHQNQGADFAFYQLSPVIAVLPAIILAFVLARQAIDKSLNQFIEGIGDSNIIAMCLIYLLAGGFAAVAKATGGVDATVALGLTLIPASLLLPGFFLIAGFIATSMGTSMGTIGALAPVAYGICQQTGIDPALMAGAVVSGAMFGDNLSIISDTTIAATRTQGCEMKDKFRENIRISAPAALLTFLLFFALGSGQTAVEAQDFELLKVLPYLTILVLAVAGLNVFIVLPVGILLAGLTAIFSGDYTAMALGKDIYAGFTGMQEIFLLSMLVGGLAALMKQQGGLNWLANGAAALIAKFSNKEQSPRAAELGMAGIVSATNLCTANNTVSIIITGSVAKDLAERHGVKKRRAASMLDIFSCINQGLIPWGAQALLAGATFKLSPLVVVSNAWYCMVLAVVAIAMVSLRKA
ncbi:Na+/H+ antiporter NhaC family protein [Ferrimonas aestuarii]|uniref:Na+/H+ antiporter NhaC family protein n=1 Tax=Ferrimonas aestuarii TaxID=2569539 RepID=A0A4U1BT57_9GAMM|nr:Na+/H+ antiporter NhaC family protein [Ferrimonas aestuarii]TKB56730.1 Na+/H+ antiporter NhaC family protein [Ferrimonas aestuarii]